MLSSTHNSSLAKDQNSTPAVHLSYECVVRERGRESASYLYEIACSIVYPIASAYLSMRVTGQNTYRNAAAREVPFTRHEAGATTYLELLEEERLEVRIVERDGTYCKAFYSAHGQELSEQIARGVVSTIQRIDVGSES
ncbi:MAG TPA: hypothetical protein DDW33_02985 [Ktedonobacter sp.]|jgi:hypothetical protein|nr:hypothetical protein [Ktedonobacter sp.]HAH01026.1 hypothetical protein [Ktedonobacter sp.]HAT44362.1 hypothetical protein [Ktedonobacter sp.]HBE24636.1 hypothetical protein [Ktedonobacter sp.]HBE29581.1 hypothetical protein [Ktedonobacter sp.]